MRGALALLPRRQRHRCRCAAVWPTARFLRHDRLQFL